MAPSPSPRNDESAAAPASPVLFLILAWALVGVPLGWGLWQTIIKAMKLFQ